MYYKKSKAIKEVILPANHSELLNLYHNLGELYTVMKDKELA